MIVECIHFLIIDKANLNNHEEDENLNKIHSSELPQPVNTSREILPIQTKESVLNFETLKTFDVESPILIVKHKKLGNRKARKVLKRINVISKLKKKSKKQTKILEEGVLDDYQAIPSIHVESLRSRRSSLDSQNIENQKIISENNITDTLTNKEGNFCDEIIFVFPFSQKFIIRPNVSQLYHIYI